MELSACEVPTASDLNPFQTPWLAAIEIVPRNFRANKNSRYIISINSLGWAVSLLVGYDG